ncbi:uncharacterized protein LOC135167437 isoform X2 [Diachasmimorpha longicaudata]|uniref:uncharacterized protein LOC135167437 isoform X2 n=1 Tax=Diachasmimorpha longicaudata TaxID=58733 RepID=UPI0030B8B384
MSTEDKAEVNEVENAVINETTRQEDEDSPTAASERSSAVSWTTPLSTTKSESSPSSGTWNTPKSCADETTLVESPGGNTAISLDDDPPPYSSVDRQSLWSPLSHIRELFCDDPHLSHDRSPELANLLEDSSRVASTPSTTVSRTYRTEGPGNVREEEPFAPKFGTICIVTVFIGFLMVLSLFAKLFITSTIGL